VEDALNQYKPAEGRAMLFACEAGDELQPQYIRGAQAVRIALSVHLVGSSAPSAEEV